LIHDRSHVNVTVVHMPAINTPQFAWCKSLMPRKAQPVPPIYQPEVCAEGVYWAAHQRHREVFIGGPTLQAIWGQRFIPGLLDRYLAHTAWDGQMYDAAPPPNRAVDLYEPVPGHQGAHGDFDDRARTRSRSLDFTIGLSSLVTSVGNALGRLGQSAPTLNGARVRPRIP
jgi:hypothetical protein